jgi:4-amino-4-deoxy-L-arabinose transferase-like glycosyltransferase
LSRAPAIVVALALVAYLALALGYAIRTPIWQNPDEPAHFNYVVYVAETGTLPELKPGDWDSQLLERIKNGRLEPADSVAAIRYESWQPPVAYLLAAPAVRLGHFDTAGRVLTLRFIGVVLGGLTLLVAYRVGILLLPGMLAAAVPVAMAGVPMFTAVSASISADPLANLLAAVVVFALVHRVTRDTQGWRWPVATGALLGLGLITKLALAIFVPLALLVVFARSRNPTRDVLALLATAALVMAPWFAHQVTTYGWNDPLAITRHAEVVGDQPRFAAFSLDYIWSFLTITFHSFWAQFGWMAIPATNTLYWIWGLLLVGAGLGLARARHRFRAPAWLLLVATLAAAFAALIAYNLTFTQFQGRYLFTALVPFAVLFVAGWSAWPPSRLQAIAGLSAAWALVALNAYTFWRVLVPGFAPAT